jgi:hypothetical protein
VKPAVLSEAARQGRVRIPLVRTAAGDLDYEVVLKYGGKRPPLEALRPSVDFPLVRTVNINVELSQVELHVPKTLDWTYWRGSMRRVTAEGEFEAGVLSYQNRLAEGLVETLRFGNPFEKARAASNLKSLSDDIQQFAVSNSSFNTSNKEFQAQSSNAQITLQKAGEEIQSQARQSEVDLSGNNDYLRDAYSGQRNVRARNIVGSLGLNWNEAATASKSETAAPADADKRFNSAWLATNSLSNPTVQAEAGKKSTKDRKGEPNQRLDMGAQMQAAQPQAPAMNQPAAPDVGQVQLGVTDKIVTKEDLEKLRQAPTGQPGQMPQRGGQQQDDVVLRYQQKLQKRAEMDQQVMNLDKERPVPRREIGGFEGLGQGRGGFFGSGGEDSTAAPAPTGLASLDVELPLRGTVYRFTTPRGDVDIRATAVSQPLIDGLVRLGAAVGLVVIVLVVRRLARRGSFGLAAQRTASTVLIVLGIAGAFCGVFPIAGVAAIFVGIGMKVWLRFARRKAAAAA